MPRQRTSATSHADGATGEAASEPAAMPRNVAMPIIKRYQALFIIVAHSEVRQSGSGGTLSTREQESLLEQSYKRHLRLWYNDDATLLQNPNFPACPPQMKAVGDCEVFIRAMMSTTGAGRHSHTGVSLLRKYKELKKDMLKLIADWNMLCGCTFGSNVLGDPPTGTLKETIYQRLLQTCYRKEETARVLKLRLACVGVQHANAPLCTPENIRLARFSCNYASRGFTKADEDADIRSYRRMQSMARGHVFHYRLMPIYAQMEAAVNADEILHAQAAAEQQSSQQASGSNETESRAPSQTSTASQNFTEAVMPAQFDIELGFAFKVFGNYEGSRHLSPFWTQAWGEFRGGSAFAGRATTQHRQNSQALAIADGRQPGAFPGTTPATLVPPSAARAAATNVRNHHEAREEQRASALLIYASMREDTRHANALERFRIQRQERQLSISNLQGAIAMATSMGASYPSGARSLALLQSDYLALVLMPSIEPPEPSVPIEMSVSISSSDDSRRVRQRRSESQSDLAPAVTAVDLTHGGSDGSESVGLPQLLEELYRRFDRIENEGAGDCAFYCMNSLEVTDVPHERLANAGVDVDNLSTNTVQVTRNRVVDHFNRSLTYVEGSSTPASSILVYGADIVPELLQDPNIAVSTVEEYCDRMRTQGTDGGVNEFAIWSDLMHVRVTIHSTAMYGGRMHVEGTGPVTYNDEPTPNYHVLHIAGYGCKGAMFVCLILLFSWLRRWSFCTASSKALSEQQQQRWW